jgi:hypothetical protein
MAQGFVRNNMLSGTRDWSGEWTDAYLWNADGTHDGFVVMSKNSAWGGLNKSVMLAAGQTYTFSACVKVEPGKKHGVGIYLSNGATINDDYIATTELDKFMQYFSDIADGKWHTISLTFTAKASKRALPRVNGTGNYKVSVCGYMLVEGDTPAAWAPAEGETLAGVSASMSANALDGITPELMGGTTQSGIWYETTASGGCMRYTLDMPAHVDSQTFNLAATVCGDSAGWLSLALEYADAAGHTNRATERLDFTTEQARRKVAIVVPSGMAVTALYVSRDVSQPASRVASIALWQGELLSSDSLVLDVGTIGDIALDVRAGYR